MSKYDFMKDRILFTKFIFRLIFQMHMTEFIFNVQYDRIVIDTKFYHEIQKNHLLTFYSHYIDFYIDLKNGTLVIMIPEAIRKL